MTSGPRRPLTVLALLICLLAACGSVDTGKDKSGNGNKVSLRLASTGFAPGRNLTHFIEAVEAKSHGDVQIVAVNAFGAYAPDAEIQLVRAVAAGDVDLGWVGSRTFDSLGVTSLQALSAPLLIDSYAVENAVLASPVADQLLVGVQAAGVTGLGMSPGAFQMPIGVDHALVTPEDWKGVTFGTYASVVQERTIRALGATPFEAFGNLRGRALDDHEIQAFHLGFPGYGSGDLPAKAPYVTTNVRLWVQVDVSIVNTETLARLSRHQRAWLLAAAAETEHYAATLDADEGQAIVAACSKGAHLVSATPGQLAVLRSALDGVYADLNKDPQTSRAITQIQHLSAITPAEGPPPIPSGCRWPG